MMENSNRTQIILAIIAALSAIFVALITNWKAIFGDDPTPKPVATQVVVEAKKIDVYTYCDLDVFEIYAIDPRYDAFDEMRKNTKIPLPVLLSTDHPGCRDAFNLAMSIRKLVGTVSDYDIFKTGRGPSAYDEGIISVIKKEQLQLILAINKIKKDKVKS